MSVMCGIDQPAAIADRPCAPSGRGMLNCVTPRAFKRTPWAITVVPVGDGRTPTTRGSSPTARGSMPGMYDFTPKVCTVKAQGEAKRNPGLLQQKTIRPNGADGIHVMWIVMQDAPAQVIDYENIFD